MDDKKILELGKAEDQSAYRYFYEKYAKNLFNLIYSFLGNREDSEEVLQETFLRFFKSIRKIEVKEGGGVYPYLKKIAINESYTKLKKRKREEKKKQMYAESIIKHRKEENYDVYDILNQIPPRQRLAVILKKIEGYSLKEVAKLMGISEKAVESLLSRAVLNISKIVAKEFRKNKSNS